VKAKIDFWRLILHTIGDFEVIPEADCAMEGRKEGEVCMFPTGPALPRSQWGQPMRCLSIDGSASLHCARRRPSGDDGSGRRVNGNASEDDAGTPMLFPCPQRQACGPNNECLQNRTGPLCGYCKNQYVMTAAGETKILSRERLQCVQIVIVSCST